MKKSVAKDWVAALRSGKYKQGKPGQLKDSEGNYCCLGVLCEISGLEYQGSNGTLPYSVQIFSGLKSSNGRFDYSLNLADLNDNHFNGFYCPVTIKERYTFEEIADIIEVEYKNL